MPQLALGVAGAAVASWAFGASATFLGVSAASWGLLAGSVIGGVVSDLLLGKGPKAATPEFNATGSAPGAPIPIVFGIKRMGSTLLQAGDVSKTSTSGSKLGGPTQDQYFQTIALQLAESIGAEGDVLKIWADKDLIYDKTTTTKPTKGFKFDHILYTGAEDQLPDPHLEAIAPDGVAPAYRGTAYMVLPNFPLTKFGNRIPQFEFLIASATARTSPAVILDPVFVDDDGVGHATVERIKLDHFEPYVYAITDSAIGKCVTKHSAVDGSLVAKNDLNEDMFPHGGAWSYTVAPLPAPQASLLWTLYQDALGACFVCLDKTTLKVAQISNSSWAPLHTISNFDTIATSADGQYVAAVAPHLFATVGGNLGVGRSACTALWTEFANMGDNTPAAGGTCCQFDNEGYLRVGLGNGGIAKYRVTTDTAFNVGVELLDTIYPHDDGVAIAAMPYNPQTNELLVFYTNGRMTRVSLDHESVVGDMDFTYVTVDALGGRANFIDDKQGWITEEKFVSTVEASGGTIYLFDAGTGSETAMAASHWSGEGSSNHQNAGYEALTETIFTSRLDTGLARLLPERASAQTLTLGAVMDAVCAMAGLDGGQYDNDALTAEVRGASIDQTPSAARDFIAQLQSVFFFDIADTGTALRTQPRGTPAAFAVNDDDLGAASFSQTAPERLTATRAMDLDLPVQFDLVYPDPDRDYQGGTQSAQRAPNTQYGRTKASNNVPVVLSADEARTVATRSLAELWASRETYAFSVPITYAFADSIDGAIINRDGRTFLVRCTSIGLSADYSLVFEAGSYFPEVYALTAAAGGSVYVPATVAFLSPPEIAVLDTALFRQSDDQPGNYVAVGPSVAGAEWEGAVAQESTDGVAFSNFASLAGIPVWGRATALLGDCPRWPVWDTTNALQVSLMLGTVASCSKTDLVADPSRNLAALKSGDAWELLQFASAVQGDDGIWHLSTLLRGRRGTEQHIAGHGVGDRFVLIDQAAILNHAYSAGEIGAQRYYRAENGSLFPFSAVEKITQTTRRLLPFAPFHILGSRNMAGDLTLTWLRRSRLPGRPLWSAPLFEDVEAYEIDVFAGDGSVVRTLTATLSGNGSGVTDAANRTAVYKAADQTLDFGSHQATVNLQVFQMSETVGRGYGRKVAA